MKKLLFLLFFLLTAKSFGATYELKERVVLRPQPDAKLIEVWIPIPYENRWQRIKKLKIESPFPYILQKEPEYGNKFLYIRKEGGLREPVEIKITAIIEREELKPTRFEDKLLLRFYLPDRLVPISSFKKLAFSIVNGKKTEKEKLKAIYDYVVSNMKYDKSGTGWGRGDAIWACNSKKGNCTDFHSLFIALSRAVNIGAVFEIGLPINKNGLIKSYHCWVLAFPQKEVFGIDASEAAKHKNKRDYFFGHLDDKRIGITRGRNILLNPPQHGKRLNYLCKAYEEVDLRPTAGVETYYFVKKLF
ncbi:MAG: transglutaminase domain-containing protein [Desulfurobacteriaceae bacterium]